MAATFIGGDEFVEDHDERRSWTDTAAPAHVKTREVLFGEGPNAVEVAFATATKSLSKDELVGLWERRHGKRAAPVLVVVVYPTADGEAAAVCGPVLPAPSPVVDLDPGQVERLAAAALAAPNRQAATKLLLSKLDSLAEGLISGLRNSGLFAVNELRHGVRERADWAAACERGEAMLDARRDDVLTALGYSTEKIGTTGTLLIEQDGARSAVAVLLDEEEQFDVPSGRLTQSSPATYGLSLARRPEYAVSWVVLVRGSLLRLYPSSPDVGVGRKGQTQTFVEIDRTLLRGEDAGYLALLFGAGALRAGGTVEAILDSSKNFASELGKRLRDRIYVDVVPGLATAIARRGGGVTEQALGDAYHRTLLLLFRLLFIAYAEDRGLLPKQNAEYEDHSLKRKARRFTELVRDGQLGTLDERSTAMWRDVATLFEAVDIGNAGWGVPAYDGGLFRSTEGHGQALADPSMGLPDAVFGRALAALLVDDDPDGEPGPVDFRSLSVREFGTIYEGLLESSLSIAPFDLIIDGKGTYVPAPAAATPVVAAGEVYFHDRSGARKSSGSYFTKQFAVEHLLDHALEPALGDHLARIDALLDQGDEAAAAEAFFDFRVADLAMGSGHFLVAAVDRIEARLSAQLAQRPIASVLTDLDRLRQAAETQLGALSAGVEIENGALLRRQIARRCVYGLDLNDMAVELARLGLWIHTFVPGLPLSFLSHGLRQGNSLTGIATIEEAVGIFAPESIRTGQSSLFEQAVRDALDEARVPLRQLAMITELTPRHTLAAEKAHLAAMGAVEPARKLFNLAVAIRLGEATIPIASRVDGLIGDPQMRIASATAHRLGAIHLPVAFPEVFVRERPGFDCILGNPPWEKLQVEEHGFFALRFPGLKGLEQEDAENALQELRRARPDLVKIYSEETAQIQLMTAVLSKSGYPGFSAGRPDLYKAFAWRCWTCVRENGYAGLVLPRKALEASGMSQWRKHLVGNGGIQHVVTATNTKHWVFDEVDLRMTVAFVVLHKQHRPEQTIVLKGPYTNRGEFLRGMSWTPLAIRSDELLTWSPTASLPLIASVESLNIFLKMRQFPRLDLRATDDFRVGGLREFNATDDKDKFRFGFDGALGGLPVYKGDSFDIWNPETGSVYASIEERLAEEWLFNRRLNQARIARSALYGLPAAIVRDPRSLSFRRPRIAWRDTARATDTRTVRPALIPPNVVLVHQAYYLFFQMGGPKDEAFVLGVLSSRPFDWYARQIVESHATVEFLRSAPVPRVGTDTLLRMTITSIAGQLAATDKRFSDWADAVGVEVGSVADSATRQDLIATNDAAVALMYGLEANELVHVFSTFHRGWDCSESLDAVMKHYNRLSAMLDRSE